MHQLGIIYSLTNIRGRRSENTTKQRQIFIIDLITGDPFIMCVSEVLQFQAVGILNSRRGPLNSSGGQLVKLIDGTDDNAYEESLTKCCLLL
jgi:hypothetical protein